MAVSELSRKRFRKFRRNRRAWWSLVVLSLLFLLSLFSEFLANDKPLFFLYEGGAYFPVFSFYPATEFGGEVKTEANYRELTNDDAFLRKTSLLVRAPIPHSPIHGYLDYEGVPPWAPSARHWLGTDAGGRDVLARLIYGFRSCMLFSLCLTFVAIALGAIVGAVQGYFKGWVDLGCQRVIEIWSALPFLYIIIFFGSVFGRGFMVLLLCMAMFLWIGLSYYMRGEFLRLSNLGYVRAAKVLGYGNIRILFRHILPNAMTPVLTFTPFLIISGISALTSLDFLGFGMPPPSPSWGEMLAQGLKNLYAPWITLSVVFALFVTLLMAAFVGEGIRDAFDPKSGDRYE